jgi:hypothetical protein
MDWDYIKHWCEMAGLSRMFVLTLQLVSRFFMLEVDGFQRTFGDLGEMKKSRMERSLSDYASPFFGKTDIGSHMRRKSSLLYVAERPMTKLKQLLCFFTMKEAQAFFRQLFRSRAAREPLSAPQRKG